MSSVRIRDLKANRARGANYAQLVAAGIIRPAIETGDPLADWPTLRAVSYPHGTAAALIAEVRGS